MTAIILIFRSVKKKTSYSSGCSRSPFRYLTCLKRKSRRRRSALFVKARSFSRFPVHGSGGKRREQRVWLTPVCVSLRQLNGFNLLRSLSVVASERADILGMSWSFSLYARGACWIISLIQVSDSRKKLLRLSRGLSAEFVGSLNQNTNLFWSFS